ncbi:MAG: maltoporin [Burkholderiales bacterium]
MRFKYLAALTISAFTPFSAIAAGNIPIDFHGYLRSGTGAADEGGKQACFQLQGAASKYRLGNECETWLEIELGAEVAKIDRTSFAVHTMLSYNAPQNTGTESNVDALQQAWGEAKNLGDGALATASAWAGKRYYKRQGPHLNDYRYLSNEGQGGGIENISIGPGKVSYAYIRQVDPANALISQTNHDFRYEGLPTNPNGNIDVAVIFGRKNNADNVATANQNGTLFHVQHNQNKIFGNEGYNKLVFQYADKNIDLSYGSTPGTYDGKQWRLLDNFFIDMGRNLQAEGVISYTEADSSGASKNAGTPDGSKWLSAGIRPVYSFTKIFSLAAEIGFDQIDPELPGAKTTRLTKFTIAPQISAGTGYWARPTLRAFATFADWNEKGAVLPNDARYNTKTSGWSYGVQAEAWW